MKSDLRIGFSLNRSKGGPAFFMSSLKNTLDNLPNVRTSYFFDPFVTVNLFANKPRIVQFKPYFFRVDGVAFDIKMSIDSKKHTNLDLIKGIRFAQGVIFQSEFSRRLSESILHIKPYNSATILNGTNLELFSPRGGNIRNKLGIEDDSIVFITSAKWRAHKRLKSIVKVFQKLKGILLKKAYLIIIGEPDFNIERDNQIISLGKVSYFELPSALRAGDIFLYFSWLDNCPNSVVEAIACGLPVICTNQGGTREIIEATAGGIVVDADEPFGYEELALYEPPEPNYSMLIESCISLVNELEYYKAKITTNSIDINSVALSYLSFIKAIRNEKY